MNQKRNNLKTSNLSAVDTWARDMLKWYWSTDTPFLQLPVDHNIVVLYEG